MYPSYANYSLPYPVNPASSALSNPLNSYSIGNAQNNSINHSTNPLDGVTFKLSPALELSSGSQFDSVLDDVKRTLERVRNILESGDYTYDGTLERNFLRDNRGDG